MARRGHLNDARAEPVLRRRCGAALPDGSGGTRPPKNVFESEAAEGLTAAQTMAARNFINRVAGSQRAMGHGQLYTGIGNLDYMRYQIEDLKPDTWKGYNIATAAKVDFDANSDMRRWRLDDEAVAYPTYDLIRSYATPERMRRYPGFRTLCVHKGLSTNAGREPELGHPMDIPKAATDYPDFNFVIYNACIRPGFWVLNALTDIRSGRLRNGPGEFDVGVGLRDGVPDILWSTEFAYISRPFRNVYAEIGTTFASCVITFPTVCAHLFGQWMKIMGEDRILFGSDSVHYRSPQWQIEALWRFEIPEQIRKDWGYPPLSKGAKRKILGLNAARLYKVPVGGFVGDDDQGGFGGEDDQGGARVQARPPELPAAARRRDQADHGVPRRLAAVLPARWAEHLPVQSVRPGRHVEAEEDVRGSRRKTGQHPAGLAPQVPLASAPGGALAGSQHWCRRASRPVNVRDAAPRTQGVSLFPGWRYRMNRTRAMRPFTTS
jgi:predicted TIM-barrel fold metal-dependent hydrolase